LIPDRLFEDLRVAEQLYSEAIQHDPSFALAHARLSATLARIYHWFDPTAARKARIKSEAEKSLQLNPDLGEGHLALGLYYYWAETARARDRLVALAPTSPYAKIARAYIDFYSAGDTTPLAKVLAAIPAGVDPSGLVTRARWDLAMIKRDYAAADRALDGSTV